MRSLSGVPDRVVGLGSSDIVRGGDGGATGASNNCGGAAPVVVDLRLRAGGGMG